MVAAALADLPVHAGAPGIVHVQPVHAQVACRLVGVCRVDERQRDERAAVFRPAGERGETMEMDVARDAIDDRPAWHAPRTDLQQLAADVARIPELSRRRRQQRLREVHDASNQPQRPFAERHLGAAGRAEQIRDEPEVGTFDVGEEQRGTVRGNHTPMNLRRFEVGVDLRVDRDKVVVPAKLVEERAEVSEHEIDDGRRTIDGLKSSGAIRQSPIINRQFL